MHRHLLYLAASLFALLSFSFPALADAVTDDVTKQGVNIIAISIFMIFVISTLAITWWAAHRTKSREAFYTASGGITPVQNAFAIAGDFMSAATLLGITGLMFFVGIDGFILSFTIIIGWALMLMLIAERFRNLGRFTIVDVISYRLEGNSVRILMAVCSLTVIIFYLIGQMVGAGKLIQLLFGLDYNLAVISVSILMVLYVTFGGMLATTWVQMIKAVLLIMGGAFIVFALLTRFGFDLGTLFKASTEAHDNGQSIMQPGGWLKRDPMNVLTVGLTMTFGIMGLPHILMRFFTVKDAVGARKSVAYATLIMAIFYIFILIIGLGSIAILWNNPNYYDAAGALTGGSNMVALHAAKELGGEIFFGFMAAVAFATILAVVAGLTLAGSAAIAHDLYAVVLKKGNPDPKKELNLSRIVVLAIGALSILLGLAFESQNIAVVTSFALALAASVNFPLLLLAMYWKSLSSRGAILGGSLTFTFTLILIICSHNVWVEVLGNERALVPLIYPTVYSMPMGFILIWLFSVLDKSDSAQGEKERFDEQFIQSETGIGTHEASLH